MLIKNEKYFMFRDTIPYIGSVWYIKELVNKKIIAIISPTDCKMEENQNLKYDRNNKYVKIDFWKENNFTQFFTGVKIEGQEVSKVAKKIFKTLKDTKEERIKEALNLFPAGIVGHTTGK